jgi:hypothetical protein
MTLDQLEQSAGTAASGVAASTTTTSTTTTTTLSSNAKRNIVELSVVRVCVVFDPIGTVVSKTDSFSDHISCVGGESCAVDVAVRARGATREAICGCLM